MHAWRARAGGRACAHVSWRISGVSSHCFRFLVMTCEGYLKIEYDSISVCGTHSVSADGTCFRKKKLSHFSLELLS